MLTVEELAKAGRQVKEIPKLYKGESDSKQNVFLQESSQRVMLELGFKG